LVTVRSLSGLEAMSAEVSREVGIVGLVVNPTRPNV